jgi:hypothetical protein
MAECKNDLFAQHFIGKYVIIRSVNMGVRVGILSQYKDGECILSDAREIWRWVNCANTIYELSLTGISMESKVTETVPHAFVGKVEEILPCTKLAEDTFRKAIWAPDPTN